MSMKKEKAGMVIVGGYMYPVISIKERSGKVYIAYNADEKIFNYIPKIGIADIKTVTENHKIIRVTCKYFYQKKDAGL